MSTIDYATSVDYFVKMARELASASGPSRSTVPIGETVAFIYNQVARLNEPAPSAQPEAFGQEKLGIASVASNAPNVVELNPNFTEDELQVVIRACYKQVFGNTYILESDRLTQAESLLRNKSVSVREFVRLLAKSDLYKERFFFTTNNNRFIELTFKHLLGRAPYNQAEISEHLDRYQASGYDAEVDSYIDSEEYRENFGESIVPYFRGFKYQTNQSAAAFPRLLKLYGGDAGSDTDRNSQGQRAALITNLATPAPTVEARKPTGSIYYGQSGYFTEPADSAQPEAFGQEKLGIASVASNEPNIVELNPNFTEDALQVVIRACYKQVFGNTYILESDRLTQAESLLRNKSVSVREFVRLLAKSDLYKERFFFTTNNNRFIELNCKHLLGRPPYSQAEIVEHLDRYESIGCDGDIDSYLDSEEYRENFGENIVPYIRGFKYQVNQSGPAFERMLKLYSGDAGSDTDRNSQGQRAELITDLATLAPSVGVPGAEKQLTASKTQAEASTAVNPSLSNILNQAGYFNRGSTYAQTDSYAQEKLGITSVATPSPDVVELNPYFSEDELQVVIRAAYKQVFGNTYILESDRLAQAESLLRNKSVSVREFVRLLAKSDLYKERFFFTTNNNRFIELNCKHLLGRAPYNQGEIATHFDLYSTSGYDADIDSYIDSEEYRENFGESIVPYFRGFKYQTSQSAAAFPRLLKLYGGDAGSDTDRTREGQQAELITDLAKKPEPIVMEKNLYQERVAAAIERKLENIPGLGSWLNVARSLVGENNYIQRTPSRKPETDWKGLTAPALEAQPEAFGQRKLGITSVAVPVRVELNPYFSEDELQVVIRAAYKQVFGNTYILESDRLTQAESLLRNKSVSVREFVRLLAKSDLYKERFFFTTNNNRFIELTFKHLLGRAPYNQAEISEHLDRYQASGYDAEVDSYIDSEEYRENFGESIVPYFRGFKYQTNQSGPAFPRLLKLYGGDAGSDTDRNQEGQRAALITDLAAPAPTIEVKVTFLPQSVAPAAARKESVSDWKTLTSGAPSAQPEAFGQKKLGITSVASNTPNVVELNPNFTEDELQVVIRAAYKQVFGNTYILESERLTQAESLLRNKSVSVREFIRLLAKSDLYKERFFFATNNNRFIELNLKHLLGRALYSQSEIVMHFDLYSSKGYGADIDSYIDSEEYRENFGENIVPYFRGFKYQANQSAGAFTRMKRLFGGDAGSDTDRARSGQLRQVIPGELLRSGRGIV